MKENNFSRRAFVQKYFYAGVVLVGGVVVFGCNSSPKGDVPAHVPPVREPVKPPLDKLSVDKDTVKEVVKDKVKETVEEKVKPVKQAKRPVAKEPKKDKIDVGKENCDDLSDVAPAELQKRKKLAYVNSSPIPDNNCANCALHIPAKAGKSCGGCMLFKGPVRDEGYCAYWAPINS